VRGTVLTLGGGGFSGSEDGSSLLDDLLLSLTGKDRPRVCFVPTASGDDSGYAERFLDAFAGRAETRVLSLFCKDPWGYGEPGTVLDQDVVYVGGGSTANLLAVWRLHGLDRLLEQAAAAGTVLAGISAGMNCWFEGSSTDSFGPLQALPDGLGLLPGSACPHYFGEADRQAAYHRMVGTGALPDGHAADDGVALLWRDGALVEAVAERPDGQAFRVERRGDEVVEIPLAVRYLG
jgi:peptidase E